jgi:hypothetical protein
MNPVLLIPRAILFTLFLIVSAEAVFADTIYFEGGVKYDRNLKLSYTGSKDSPVVITSRGNGKAIISAGSGYGLLLEGCTNVTISNIIFKGKGRLSGNSNDGVVVNNCHNITIDDIEIQGFQHSGLLVQGSSSDIKIEKVYAHDNGFAGIQVIGNWPDKYQCKNIYIGHCKAENNPGDPTVLTNHSGNGIIVGACDSVLIEYCEATGNGWDMPRTGNGPVGIWAWHANNVTIQHCISHKNKTSVGAADGGGFDLDGGTANSIIQYCLSYENEGAGYGIFEYVGASPLINNTLRYNISINDGIKNGNACVLFWNGSGNSGLLTDVFIYNNVFYNSKSNGASVYFFDPYQKNIFFANNIFLSRGPALQGTISNSDFLGNIYWNLDYGFQMDGFTSFENWARATGQEMLDEAVLGMNMDPLLKGAGPVTLTDPDSLNLETLSGFTLKAESPVINKGLDLFSLKGIDAGAIDFFDQKTPEGSGFEPGIYEFQEPTDVHRVKNNVKNPRQLTGDDDWFTIVHNPPENGMIYIKIDNPESMDILKVKLSDILGRTIQSEQFRATGETISFKTDAYLPGGLYFISATLGTKYSTVKIYF